MSLPTRPSSSVASKASARSADLLSRLHAAMAETAPEAAGHAPLSRGMAVHALTREGYLLAGVVHEVRAGGVEVLFNSRVRQHVKESFFAFERLARPDERIAVIMEGGRNIEGEKNRHFRIDRLLYPQEHLPADAWPHESYCVELQEGILLQGASKSPGVLRFLDQLPSRSITAALPKKGVEFDLPGARSLPEAGRSFVRASFGRGEFGARTP